MFDYRFFSIIYYSGICGKAVFKDIKEKILDTVCNLQNYFSRRSLIGGDFSNYIIIDKALKQYKISDTVFTA